MSNLELMKELKNVTYILHLVFCIIALILYKIAKIFNTTYECINIIVYYLLIPLSWGILLDIYIGFPIITYSIILIWIGIFIATKDVFKEWSNWIFEDSVKILKFFGNYVISSVIICVIIPIIIYVFLFWLIL